MDGSTISRWRFQQQNPKLTHGTHPSVQEQRLKSELCVHHTEYILSRHCICPEEFTLGCPLPEWLRGPQSPSELLLGFLYFGGGEEINHSFPNILEISASADYLWFQLQFFSVCYKEVSQVPLSLWAGLSIVCHPSTLLFLGSISPEN